jgi:hypothetical protein
MSNIDFTKPVETIDGTPVQIVSTEGRGRYPILGYIGHESQYITSWSSDGFYLSDKSESDFNLRNKATWQLPAPPEGQQWHRVDGWTEEMLPAGYRPLLVGETGSYQYMLSHGKWKDGFGIEQAAWLSDDAFWRTDRPLPQPQEPWAAEKAAFAAGETIQYKHPFMLEWKDFTGLKPAFERDLGIIWRIKPKPQKVPLEPCDVPPGSVIRGAAWQGKWSQCYIFVLEVTPDGVFASRGWEIYTWKALSESWQIKRPTDTEWQPCYKETQP